MRRSDELLTELIELVETARAVPMSASCVVPRERVLDLLDELREVLPPEMDQARTVIARRDQVMRDAHETAAAARERAVAEADTVLADAGHRAEALVADAEQRAEEIARRRSRRARPPGRRHHRPPGRGRRPPPPCARTPSATSARSPSRPSSTTPGVRAEADHYAHRARTEAEMYATKLTADAEDYAERTLDELAAVLNRSAQTAEQGRAGAGPAPAPWPGAPQRPARRRGRPAQPGDPARRSSACTARRPDRARDRPSRFGARRRLR